MRWWIGGLVVALMVGGCATARQPSVAALGRPVRVVQGDVDSSENRRILERLDGSSPAVVLDAKSLESVLGYVGEQGGFGVDVEWDVLRGAGVFPNTPITLSMPAKRWSNVLRGVLAEVEGDEPLGFMVVDGVVRVSTRAEFQTARYRMARAYDIRDLSAEEVNARLKAVLEDGVSLLSVSVVGSELWVRENIEGQRFVQKMLGGLGTLKVGDRVEMRYDGQGVRRDFVAVSRVDERGEISVGEKGVVRVAGLTPGAAAIRAEEVVDRGELVYPEPVWFCAVRIERVISVRAVGLGE